MSEQFGYAKNDICRIENFAEHLAAGTFPRIELGQLCGMKWYSTLRITANGSGTYPIIWCDNSDPKVEHRVQIYYKLENHSRNDKKSFKKTKKEVLKFDKASTGFDTPILDILDMKNGWLDIDGALSFEYGIQVEAIMKHKIWRFNFKDKLSNGDSEMTQIKKERKDSRRAGYLYSHLQLLKFHSQLLKNSSFHMMAYRGDRAALSDLSKVLQIVNGVRLKLKVSHLIGIICVAEEYEMSNVIHYCDWYLVTKSNRKYYEEEEKDWIFAASCLGLRQFLVYLLKPMKILTPIPSTMISGQAYLENLQKTEQEKIAKLNAAPIKKDIVGDWTLVTSSNTQAYLAEKNLGRFHDATFLACNQSFLVNFRQVTQLHLIGNEVVDQLHECIGFQTRKPHYTRKTTVQDEGTNLITMETWYAPDGKFIVNQTKKGEAKNWESVNCVRVYQKIDKAATEESAKTDFNGTWRPVANDRFEKYCAMQKITGLAKRMMGGAHVSLSVLTFLREFHSIASMPRSTFEQKYIARLDEDCNGFVTSFRGNQLVTVGEGIEIIRVVQNGKLFITTIKDNSSFMMVYEKI
ncbi:unnamed protein product [Caenorhabditis brenneri]